MNQEDSHLLLPVDSAWLALERPENPMTITVMLRVDGLTEPRLREFLAVYWLAWQRFRYVPVQRSPGWWWQEDTVFDLRHHLQVAREPFTHAQLQDWVSARLNQPLPAYRPLWKFWLAPHAEGGAALILRMHHCYADGLSLLGVFERICPPSPRQLPAIYGSAEQADVKRWGMAAGAWLKELIGEEVAAASGARAGSTHGPAEGASGSLEGAGRVLERFAQSGLKLVNEVSQFLIEPEDSPSSLRRPLLGRRQCCWSEPIALERFRQVASATGVTINDVLLSCVAAAVRKQLAAGPTDLDEAVLHAAVPVDIRGQLPAGIKPEPGALGNCFGTVFVPLPVDGESSLERLFRIKHETRRLKKSWQPGIAWGLTASASLVPEPWREPVADVFYRKASAVVSNVPGSREERFLAGCRITEQMFWVPQAGDIGLGVSIVSYADRVQFGVVADEAVLGAPSQFLTDCLEELAALGS